MVAWPRAMSGANRPIAAIVLAAGKGTRMKSDTHKVLHPVAGRPMIEHLLASLGELAPERTVVVVGDLRDQLEAALGGKAEMAVQEPQLGTGHAVQQAEGALGGFRGRCADPLRRRALGAGRTRCGRWSIGSTPRIRRQLSCSASSRPIRCNMAG